ncbi:hypothetical protein ABW21_db0200701 [Orbilia brochopaga]|nr:hypothetical protein ABW21_db0200701 [Drechslerella brochopaga]
MERELKRIESLRPSNMITVFLRYAQVRRPADKTLAGVRLIFNAETRVAKIELSACEWRKAQIQYHGLSGLVSLIRRRNARWQPDIMHTWHPGNRKLLFTPATLVILRQCDDFNEA